MNISSEEQYSLKLIILVDKGCINKINTNSRKSSYYDSRIKPSENFQDSHEYASDHNFESALIYKKK